MTTYTLPAEPSGPVWLTEPTNPANVVRYYRVDGPAGPRWYNDAADELAWVELLALGEVEDEYPGGYEFHGTATPWYVDPNNRRDILGADGDKVVEVLGASTSTEDDVALAKLIVELVNAHAAPAETAAAVEDDPRSYARTVADRLALAVNELALTWRCMSAEAREGIPSGLQHHLANMVEARDAANR